MAFYEGDILKVDRKLDGKGRLQLPGDFREAVGFAPDEEVQVAAVRLMEREQLAIMITSRKGGKQA